MERYLTHGHMDILHTVSSNKDAIEEPTHGGSATITWNLSLESEPSQPPGANALSKHGIVEGPNIAVDPLRNTNGPRRRVGRLRQKPIEHRLG